MEITTDDVDDQAGHGENYEQNGEEGDGQDREEVVDLTCVMNTFFFALPYLSLSFLTPFFFSLVPSWTSEREGLFCSVLFPCVFLPFFVFRGFVVFSFSFFCAFIRTQYVDSSFTFSS